MTDRTPPQRHPSTLIPTEIVENIAYHVYLRRLEPPLTPEESATKVYRNTAGKVTSDDAMRRRSSVAYQSMTRDFLHVLVDLGMVKP